MIKQSKIKKSSDAKKINKLVINSAEKLSIDIKNKNEQEKILE